MAVRGKNLHMEHLEDEIINLGIEGGKKAIKILREMGKFLSGDGNQTKVTTKFDGAPAIICGTDPDDGKFFVGTKSVFAKDNPKICKSESDIQRLYDGTLATKLTAAFKHLQKCQIKGVLQGDLMFTDDKKKEMIQGDMFVSFRPNTITYAVKVGTNIEKKISAAKLGIVFHTKYTGPSLAEMTSSFDVNERDYKETPDTWIEKAEYKDIGGVARFSATERQQYESAVNRAEGSLKQTGQVLDKIQSGKKTLQIDTEFKKFFNKYVKNGKTIPPVTRTYKEFLYHLAGEYDKVISKNKTLKAQADKAGKFIDAVVFFEQHENEIKMLIASYMNIQVAKNILVEKMNKVGNLHLFVDMGNGDYKPTTPEGFVAISGTDAVKLIDRLEFARLNFTVPKNW